MNRSITRRMGLAFASTALTLSLVPAAPAFADPAPETGVETNVASSNWVAVPAEFNYADAQNSALPALKQLRGEMWDSNVPYNGSTLQAVAKSKGLNTRDAYVNAVKIDRDANSIALQRAAEQLPNSLSHSRPVRDADCQKQSVAVCKDAFSATVNGKRVKGENLAMSPVRDGMPLSDAVSKSWGHGELAALKAAKGEWNTDNGHLHNLLNPDNKLFGFAGINSYSKKGKWQSFAANVVVSGTHVAENRPDKLVETNLYRAAVKGETPTGVVEYEKPSQSGLGATAQKVLSVLGIVLGIAGVLAAIYGWLNSTGLLKNLPI